MFRSSKSTSSLIHSVLHIIFMNSFTKDICRSKRIPSAHEPRFVIIWRSMRCVTVLKRPRKLRWLSACLCVHSLWLLYPSVIAAWSFFINYSVVTAFFSVRTLSSFMTPSSLFMTFLLFHCFMTALFFLWQLNPSSLFTFFYCLDFFLLLYYPFLWQLCRFFYLPTVFFFF